MDLYCRQNSHPGSKRSFWMIPSDFEKLPPPSDLHSSDTKTPRLDNQKPCRCRYYLVRLESLLPLKCCYCTPRPRSWIVGKGPWTGRTWRFVPTTSPPPTALHQLALKHIDVKDNHDRNWICDSSSCLVMSETLNTKDDEDVAIIWPYTLYSNCGNITGPESYWNNDQTVQQSQLRHWSCNWSIFMIFERTNAMVVSFMPEVSLLWALSHTLFFHLEI